MHRTHLMTSKAEENQMTNTCQDENLCCIDTASVFVFKKNNYSCLVFLLQSNYLCHVDRYDSFFFSVQGLLELKKYYYCRENGSIT